MSPGSWVRLTRPQAGKVQSLWESGHSHLHDGTQQNQQDRRPPLLDNSLPVSRVSPFLFLSSGYLLLFVGYICITRYFHTSKDHVTFAHCPICQRHAGEAGCTRRLTGEPGELKAYQSLHCVGDLGSGMYKDPRQRGF